MLKHLQCAECTGTFDNCHASKDCLKLPMLMSGYWSSTGSEFQTDGPATEKAYQPYVLSRYLQLLLYKKGIMHITNI